MSKTRKNPKFIVKNHVGDLEAQIKLAQSYGYTLIDSDDTTAELVKAPQFDWGKFFLYLLLSFIVIGIPLMIIFFFKHFTQGESRILLDIEAQKTS
jgi:hypothetical protein